MQSIGRALLAVSLVLASALPAAAQGTAMDSGPSLIMVWVWILIAGVIIFIVGTSMGVSSGKK
jgi:hypothetical protein